MLKAGVDDVERRRLEAGLKLDDSNDSLLASYGLLLHRASWTAPVVELPEELRCVALSAVGQRWCGSCNLQWRLCLGLRSAVAIAWKEKSGPTTSRLHFLVALGSHSGWMSTNGSGNSV